MINGTDLRRSPHQLCGRPIILEKRGEEWGLSVVLSPPGDDLLGAPGGGFLIPVGPSWPSPGAQKGAKKGPQNEIFHVSAVLSHKTASGAIVIKI